ncbi:MAG: hypothetical protein LGB01_00405 [Sulfurovum sp.]|nr:hypothetical protein [Sulfurovum sp.]
MPTIHHWTGAADALQLLKIKKIKVKPASISDIVLLSPGTGKVDALP